MGDRDGLCAACLAAARHAAGGGGVHSRGRAAGPAPGSRAHRRPTAPPSAPAGAAPQKGEGPIAVIVAPTRELAEQIHKEAREAGGAGGGEDWWGCTQVHEQRPLQAALARTPACPPAPPALAPPARPAGRFGKPYGLQVCAAFGGLSKHQQFKDLRGGCEVRAEPRPAAQGSG